MCVLRATGRPDEAEALEHTDFARALAAARLATEDPTQEHTVLAEEAERVAEAETLAQLVTPLLAERLRLELRSADTRSAATNSSHMESRPPSAPVPTAVAPSRVSEAPPIADLIESMLSQQPPAPTAGAKRS